jgi:hypothetical protein
MIQQHNQLLKYRLPFIVIHMPARAAPYCSQELALPLPTTSLKKKKDFVSSHIAMPISCLVKLLYYYDELLPMFARRLELLRYSCWWNYWLFFSRRLPSWLNFIAITVVRFVVRSRHFYDQSAHTHCFIENEIEKYSLTNCYSHQNTPSAAHEKKKKIYCHRNGSLFTVVDRPSLSLAITHPLWPLFLQSIYYQTLWLSKTNTYIYCWLYISPHTQSRISHRLSHRLFNGLNNCILWEIDFRQSWCIWISSDDWLLMISAQRS